MSFYLNRIITNIQIGFYQPYNYISYQYTPVLLRDLIFILLIFDESNYVFRYMLDMRNGQVKYCDS